MPYRLMLAFAAVLALPMLAAAEQPNIEPGMWEYENHMTYEGDMPIPDQSVSNRECVTLEDIEQGDAFFDDEDMEECTLTHSDIRSEGMDYTLECIQQEFRFTMDGTMEFFGDRVTGVITGNMETPMGPVTMHMDMEGRHVGDC